MNTEQRSAIETLKKGDMIRLIRAGKASAKVYLVAGYCRLNKAYMVDDADDISRDKALKKGTIVEHGFTY